MAQDSALSAVTSIRARRAWLALAAGALVATGGLVRAGEDRPDETPAERPAVDGPAADGTETSPAPAFRLGLSASAWFGSLSGYLQTSREDQAGTTDYERPELDEIGLDGMQVLPTADLRLTLFGDHEVVVDWEGIAIDGYDVPDQPLTSQGVTFPAGSAVESGLELHMIRVGYRAGWILPDLGEWRHPPRDRRVDQSVLVHADLPHRGRRGRSLVRHSSFRTSGCWSRARSGAPSAGRSRSPGWGTSNGATLLDVDLRVSYPFSDEGGIKVSGVVGLRGRGTAGATTSRQLYNEIDLRVGAFSTDPWADIHAGLRVEF